MRWGVDQLHTQCLALRRFIVFPWQRENMANDASGMQHTKSWSWTDDEVVLESGEWGEWTPCSLPKSKVSERLGCSCPSRQVVVPMANEARIALFMGIGLSKAKAEETLKNASLSQRLEQAVNAVRLRLFVSTVTDDWPHQLVVDGCYPFLLQAKAVCPDLDKAQGSLLYTTASQVKSTERVDVLAKYVAERKIATQPQINGTGPLARCTLVCAPFQAERGFLCVTRTSTCTQRIALR